MPKIIGKIRLNLFGGKSLMKMDLSKTGNAGTGKRKVKKLC